MKAKVSPPDVLAPACIRAIAAVIEEGSFAGAGRRLGLSHTAVSQQIRKFEAGHGIRLFQREQGRLQPTPLCLDLGTIAGRMQEAEEDAARLLQRRDASGQHRLRVGLGNSMPGIAIIGQLMTRHPTLSVTVETGSHQNILGAVLRREVDVAVLPDIPTDQRFRRASVLSQDVVAIVSSDHPLAGFAEVTLAQLAEQPLIFRTRGSSTQKMVDRGFRQAGLYPLPRLTADTRDAVYEAVSVGIGIGFMWRHGTHRSDTVSRITVSDMRGSFEEIVFALAEERNAPVDLFFHAAAAFRP